MEAEEIRAEIERRKKRAMDLELRELLWSLYNSHLRWYPEQLKKDPAMVLPEIKETLAIADNQYRFRISEIDYRVSYKEGKPETNSWGSRDRFDEIVTTPMTFTLYVNEVCVFTFKMKQTIQYTREMPLFSEYMGEVQSFIEGPWVSEMPELVQKMRQHENAVRERRSAPRRAQQLREDMKRFGL